MEQSCEVSSRSDKIYLSYAAHKEMSTDRRQTTTTTTLWWQYPSFCRGVKNECILSWEPVCKKLKISMVFHLGNQVKAFFDRFYDAWSDKSRCITNFRRFLWFFDSVLSTWLKFCHEKTTILTYFLTLRHFFTMIHSL